MSDPNREPIEPPGGFAPKDRPDDPSSPELQPDWLVGADDGADFASEREGPPARPNLSRPGGASPEGESLPGVPRFRLEAPPAKESREETLEGSGPEAWGPAASSVPKLTVTPRRDRSEREDSLEDDLESLDRLEDRGEGEGADEEPAAEPIPTAPQDPWWLVAVETVSTNRVLQLGILAAALVIGAFVFWPRKENQSTAIAAIKHNPQRFEGQSVRVRGEVGEVFDVGSGVVFQLHQRRDTMVVFSPNRRPATHDRLLIQGTVSTGYLDGTPRVALFEVPVAATPR